MGISWNNKVVEDKALIFPIYRALKKLRRSLAVNEKSRILFIAVIWLVLWLLSSFAFYYAETIKGGGSISISDSLYWALITMATVGYGDITPSTSLGRIVASATAIFGIAIYTLAISLLADAFLNITMRRILGMARLRKKDILVIGSDETCKHAIQELIENGLEDRIGWLTQEQPKTPPDVDFMVGDIDEESLMKAGLKDAKHVIICLDDDSKTIHTSLLVKKLNKDTTIIAETETNKTAEMLKELGLAKTISKSIIGRLLASSVFEPDVPDVITELASVEGEIDLVETTLKHDTKVQEFEKTQDAKILAIRKKDGRIIYTPAEDLEVEKGDQIVYTRKTKE